MAVAKRRSKKKEVPEDKPVPVRCKCGEYPILVEVKRRGKMVTCVNPNRCVGNFQTVWKKTEDEAIAAWNDLMKYGGDIK